MRPGIFDVFVRLHKVNLKRKNVDVESTTRRQEMQEHDFAPDGFPAARV